MANIIHGYVLTASGYIHALQVINHPNPREAYTAIMKLSSMDERNKRSYLALLSQDSFIEGLSRNFDVITYDTQYAGQKNGLKLKVKLSEGYLAQYKGPVIYIKFRGDSSSEPFLPNEVYLSADTGVLVYKDGGLTYVDADELHLNSIVPAITMKPGFEDDYTPKSLSHFKARNFDGYVRTIDTIKKIEKYDGPGSRIRSTTDTIIVAPGIFVR